MKSRTLLYPHALVVALLSLYLAGCEQGLPPSQSLEVAAKGAYAGALSEDGQFSLVGSIHHGGSLWRTDKGERLYNWNHHKGEYTSLVAADFSPDGRWAISADPHTLVLWDTQAGEALRFWTSPGEVMAVALSPEGRHALLGLSDHSAVLFDVRRGGIRRTFQHTGKVLSVDLSHDGRLAVTGSEDGTAVVWNIETGEAVHRINHGDYVQQVTISPNGQRVLSAAKYDKALVWSTDNGELLGEIPLAAERLKRGLRFTAARFSEEGRYLLTGLPDRRVQLWDTDTMRELNTWTLPKREAWKPTGAAVVALSFTEQPGHFVALASNGFIHQLDTPLQGQL